MEISNVQSSQDVIDSATESDSSTETGVGGDFDSLVTTLLGGSGGQEVNEEELFAGLIYERISSLKGSDTAARFKTLFEEQKSGNQRSDGYVAVEDSARDALRMVYEEGLLTLDEANSIHSQAFAGAQLDDNASALYDSVGGTSDDATRAVAALEQALLSARVRVEEFISDSDTPTLKDLLTTVSNTVHGSLSSTIPLSMGPSGESETISPDGTTMDGADGFLFKPISNNQGRLAVLLPAEITGGVLSVILKDSEDNEVEQGNLIPDGIAETGREKYNFARKGSEYPKDLTVEVTLADGSVRRYEIPDPAKRYD